MQNKKIFFCNKSIGKLTSSQQFDQVLSLGKKVHSEHFVLHFHFSNLSTDSSLTNNCSVDNDLNKISFLGMIIPKKWAKSSVRRSLIKRQCREQFRLLSPNLPWGSYVVRLKCGFDPEIWISASSRQLKEKVRDEIQQLFTQVQRRE